MNDKWGEGGEVVLIMGLFLLPVTSKANCINLLGPTGHMGSDPKDSYLMERFLLGLVQSPGKPLLSFGLIPVVLLKGNRN